MDSVSFLAISRNGEKALVRMSGEGPQWMIVPAMEQAKPGSGMLSVAQLQAYIDPREEWRQMYHDAWRIERDFFYDANFHGLDWAATGKRFEPYLAGLASRDDLVHLFEEMFGDITVGHLYIYGGGDNAPPATHGGLLGADYSIDHNRYRVARVYRGENWNPQLRAPLTEPGVNVKAGDYLLAVNGRELRASDDVDAFLDDRGQAGRAARWIVTGWRRRARRHRRADRQRARAAQARVDRRESAQGRSNDERPSRVRLSA